MTNEVAEKRLRVSLESELADWLEHGKVKWSKAKVKKHMRAIKRITDAMFVMLEGRNLTTVQFVLFAMLREIHHESDDPEFRRRAQRLALAHERLLLRNEVERQKANDG